jgi:hypothetical protein
MAIQDARYQPWGRVHPWLSSVPRAPSLCRGQSIPCTESLSLAGNTSRGRGNFSPDGTPFALGTLHKVRESTAAFKVQLCLCYGSTGRPAHRLEGSNLLFHRVWSPLCHRRAPGPSAGGLVQPLIHLEGASDEMTWGGNVGGAAPSSCLIPQFTCQVWGQEEGSLLSAAEGASQGPSFPLSILTGNPSVNKQDKSRERDHYLNWFLPEPIEKAPVGFCFRPRVSRSH